MKRTILFLFTSMMMCFAQAETIPCDQTHDGGELRAGYIYPPFGTEYTNNQSFKHNISSGRLIIDETESGDLNRNGATAINFHWTPQLTSQNFEVMPNQSLQVMTADTSYAVMDRPVSRDKKLRVVYQFNVQGQNPDGTWSTPTAHSDCQYYMITWCGDGVVDKFTNKNQATVKVNDEVCDSGNENGQMGKCNKDCSGFMPK